MILDIYVKAAEKQQMMSEMISLSFSAASQQLSGISVFFGM